MSKKWEDWRAKLIKERNLEGIVLWSKALRESTPKILVPSSSQFLMAFWDNLESIRSRKAARKPSDTSQAG